MRHYTLASMLRWCLSQGASILWMATWDVLSGSTAALGAAGSASKAFVDRLPRWVFLLPRSYICLEVLLEALVMCCLTVQMQPGIA